MHRGSGGICFLDNEISRYLFWGGFNWELPARFSYILALFSTSILGMIGFHPIPILSRSSFDCQLI